MTLRLKFVRESSSGKARLYEDVLGARQWVPVSVTRSTLKHPPLTDGALAVHEVSLADWWVEKNPWPATGQGSLAI